LEKSQELKKLVVVLNLFVVTIIFIILSFKRELVYVFNIIFIVDRIKRYKINKSILLKNNN